MRKFLIILCLSLLPVMVSARQDRTVEYQHARLQKYTLSCEFAALSAILTRLSGESYDEDTLISRVAKDAFGEKARTQDNKRVWGNPNYGFVGDIRYGSQHDYTGYGVYERPLKNLVESLWFSWYTLNRKEYPLGYSQENHLEDLLAALDAGDGVFLLADWCTDPRYDDGILSTRLTPADLKKWLNQKNTCKAWSQKRTLTWKTLDRGEMIDFVGLSGDHAFILIGYEGSRTHPTHIRVFDTNTGFHLYPISEWMRKWNAMDNRSLIVKNPSLFASSPLDETGATLTPTDTIPTDTHPAIPQVSPTLVPTGTPRLTP